VPELVAPVVGHGLRVLRHQFTLRRDVGDVGDIGIADRPRAMAAHRLLQMPEALGKGDLLVVGDVLAVEHDNAVPLEGRFDFGEFRVG
jgi:hypothetical protein